MKPDEALDRLATEERIRQARELLSSALRLNAMTALKLAQLDALDAQAERLRGVPGAIESGAQEKARLEAQIRADYHALMLRRQTIGDYLARVPDERHRMVLEMRYIQGMPFFRIAMQMHYDERQIYRYHRAGLRCVAVLMALENPPPDSDEKTV